MGALDDDVAPYLPAVRALLRTAVAEEVPTLGVCLGHQLLAAANGGTVERNPLGPEIGAQLVAKRSAAASRPAVRPAADHARRHPVALRRRDEAAARRDPARQLAGLRPAGVPPRPARVGRAVPHRDDARDGARVGGGRVRLDDYDLEAIVERAVAAHDDVAEVWQPFAAAFADIMRDPSSVAGGARRAHVDRRAGHRPGGDPRGARGARPNAARGDPADARVPATVGHMSEVRAPQCRAADPAVVRRTARARRRRSARRCRGGTTRRRPCDAAAAAVVAALGRTADPDTRTGRARRADRRRTARDCAPSSRASSELRVRLLPLLAVSVPLTEHLLAHPARGTCCAASRCDAAGRPRRRRCRRR